MIKSALKITVLLFVFTFILSFEVKNKTLFHHIYGLISPASQLAQKKAAGLIEESLDTTQDYTKKLFNNSVPRLRDSVQSRLSSTKKHVKEPTERITESEKAQLDDLIKNY